MRCGVWSCCRRCSTIIPRWGRSWISWWISMVIGLPLIVVGPPRVRVLVRVLIRVLVRVLIRVLVLVRVLVWLLLSRFVLRCPRLGRVRWWRGSSPLRSWVWPVGSLVVTSRGCGVRFVLVGFSPVRFPLGGGTGVSGTVRVLVGSARMFVSVGSCLGWRASIASSSAYRRPRPSSWILSSVFSSRWSGPLLRIPVIA